MIIHRKNHFLRQIKKKRLYAIHVVFFSWFKRLFINHQILKSIVRSAGMRSKN